MAKNNEVIQGLTRVGGFLVICVFIYLIGSTEHWLMIPATGALVGGFTYLAGKKNLKWTLRSTVLGLIAGAGWYFTL